MAYTYPQKTPRRPSTAVRAAKFGRADQMAHEAKERFERDGMIDLLARQKKRAGSMAAARAKNKAKESGASSGTYGGSRSSLVRSFLGK